jgi:hypothetical protein
MRKVLAIQFVSSPKYSRLVWDPPKNINIVHESLFPMEQMFLGHSLPSSAEVKNVWKISLGRDNSVGILTHYGLDGTGIESRWD